MTRLAALWNGEARTTMILTQNHVGLVDLLYCRMAKFIVAGAAGALHSARGRDARGPPALVPRVRRRRAGGRVNFHLWVQQGLSLELVRQQRVSPDEPVIVHNLIGVTAKHTRVLACTRDGPNGI